MFDRMITNRAGVIAVLAVAAALVLASCGGSTAGAPTMPIMAPNTAPTITTHSGPASPADCVKAGASMKTTRGPVTHVSDSIQTGQEFVEQFVIDPEARILYSIPDKGPIVLVNTTTGQVTGRATVPEGAHGGYIVNPANGTLYALSTESLDIVDGTSGQIVRGVKSSVAGSPRMATDFSAGVLYVTGSSSSMIQVLDAATLETIGSIDVNITDPIYFIEFDPVTCTLIATGDKQVNLIDPVASSSRSLYVGKYPYVVVDSNAGIAYQFSTDDGLVAINLATGDRQTVTTDLVKSVAVDPAAGVVYAETDRLSRHDPSSLLTINGATQTVVSTLPLGFEGSGIAVDQATGNVYVGPHNGSGPLTVFSN